MSSLLILECKQKRFLNPFQVPIFLFLFYLFGIEPVNTFIHNFPQISAKPYSIPDQTGLSLYPFSDPWRGTNMAYTREYPLGFIF